MMNIRGHSELLAALRDAERTGALDERALCAWWKFSGDDEQRYYYSQVLRHIEELQRRLAAAHAEVLRLTELLVSRQELAISVTSVQRN